jgi:hypothetical protein
LVDCSHLRTPIIRWPVSMVCVGGPCRWPVSMDCVDGPCRWPVSGIEGDTDQGRPLAETRQRWCKDPVRSAGCQRPGANIAAVPAP